MAENKEVWRFSRNMKKSDQMNLHKIKDRWSRRIGRNVKSYEVLQIMFEVMAETPELDPLFLSRTFTKIKVNRWKKGEEYSQELFQTINELYQVINALDDCE